MLLIRAEEGARCNLRSWALILLVSLLAVLPQGMLQGYAEFSLQGLASRLLNAQSYSSFSLVVGLIGLALNPVMLFLLMYVIGRSLDLSREYPMVAFSVFLGALVGGFAGRMAVYTAFPTSGDSLAITTSIVVESVGSAVSAVFVGFTAAALAFIRRPAGQEVPDAWQE